MLAESPVYLPDLLSRTDQSWLRPFGIDSTEKLQWLESSCTARRALIFALHERHGVKALTGDACRVLQWLETPLPAIVTAQRLAACACFDAIRLCIAGSVVAELRTILGARFLTALMTGQPIEAEAALTTPAPPGFAAAQAAGLATEYLASLGKTLLLASVPTSDVVAQRCVALALPKATEPMSIADLSINANAVAAVLTRLQSYD